MITWKRVVLLTVPILFGGVPRLALADAVQADPSDSFVDSIGVAVHLNYSPETSSWSTLEPLLTGLGVRHIRDGVYNNSTVDPEFVELAKNHGIKSTLVLGYTTGGVLDPTTIPTWLSFLVG